MFNSSLIAGASYFIYLFLLIFMNGANNYGVGFTRGNKKA